MKRIQPFEFAAAFISSTEELHEQFISYWHGRTVDYTSFIRGEVLPRVALKLQVEAHCADYYTLDAVFYEEKDTKYFRNGTYARCIAVAIEHENLAATSHIEMNKLQVINTPLKVLITYAKPGKETESLLGMYKEIVTWADCFGDMASLRRQLVVLGEPGDIGRWRFYVYEPSGFEPLVSP